MQILRPSVELIQVSDLAAKIAVALANRKMLETHSTAIMLEDATEDELLKYAIEEAAMLIDKVLLSE